MNLDFDLGNVVVTEFGVGRDSDTVHPFVAVPVGAGVQAVLLEMVRATWMVMQKDQDGPSKYEPSEKHGSTEYLYLPIADDLAAPLRELHEASNLSIDAAALADPSDVYCYYVRLTDNKKQRLTALRRAAQFKGVLKSRNRLVRVVDDTLQIIPDTVFKLDNDFDLLIDGANVHILRPASFEFAGKLQQAILDAVPENIKLIRKDLQFVDFTNIGTYASKHPRAARYIASIRSQPKGIDISLLRRLCKHTGVKVVTTKGKIVVANGDELDFLEALDRRRYEVNLVKDKPERYRATSRKKI